MSLNKINYLDSAPKLLGTSERAIIMSETNFHAFAKDAGNRLKSYILAYASGATGVLFLSLARSGATKYTADQKAFLLVAILFFVSTVVLSLYELHIDARRLFNIAKQDALPEEKQEWRLNDSYKRLRVRLIYLSYITVGVGTLASVMFLIARLYRSPLNTTSHAASLPAVSATVQSNRIPSDAAGGKVRPPAACSAARTANECAEILEKEGKSPYDAFGTVGHEPVYPGSAKPHQ